MATVRDRVFRILDETARSIEHLDRPAFHAIIPVIERAQRELERDLMEWLKRENGASTFTAQRYRNALLVLRRAEKSAAGIAPAIVSELKRETVHRFGPLATKNLKHDFRALSQIFEGTAHPLAINESAALAEGRRILWPQFKLSAQKYAGEFGTRVRLELATGHMRGETVDELVNRMQKRFPDIWGSSRWDAERLVRTESFVAYNRIAEEEIIQAQKEDPELCERWDATRDFRRCPMCASLDGQVIHPELGEKFVARWKTFSKRTMRLIEHVKVIEHDVAHPQCRCGRSCWRESWGKYARKAQQRPEGREFAAAA